MDQELRIKLSDRADRTICPGVLQVRTFSLEERRKRAIKFGGGSFLLGIISVALPLVHFVLVPFFLFLAPVLIWFFLKQESLVLSGTGKCPHCDADFTFAKRAPKFPYDDVCTQCRQAVRISEAREIADSQAPGQSRAP